MTNIFERLSMVIAEYGVSENAANFDAEDMAAYIIENIEELNTQKNEVRDTVAIKTDLDQINPSNGPVDNKKIVNDYLEDTYSGAKMMDDVEMQTRLARAIAAFNSDIEKDIFKENVLDF